MMNSIIGIVGSINYVGEAEKVNKGSPTRTGFKVEEKGRVEKIQMINRVNALNEKKADLEEKPYFKTEVIKDEQGKQSIILVSNHYTYRQINLSGEHKEVDETITNPVKIKAAYFNDDF